MNLLLLGNGFDLHFNLPTKYHNFLHTIDFLVKHYNDTVETVGDVFGDKFLRSTDKEIDVAYTKYHDSYDKIVLDKELIIEAINLARGNVWFSYLVKSFNKEIGWIDFEKEVGTVLTSFKVMFKACVENYVNMKELERISSNVNLDKYIILNAFSFWTMPFSNNGFGAQYANLDYLEEYPYNSGLKVVNKGKVLNKLLDDFRFFSKLMRIYMLQFIDIPLNAIISENHISNEEKLFEADVVVTLNYTKTHELLYNSNATHLHGSTSGKIILGINPNDDDNLETVDTMFVPFKKYFQRAQYGTDVGFLSEMRRLNRQKLLDDLNNLRGTEKNHLVVFGHSLDETDKDIIMELFEISDTITIFHHSPRSKSLHMSNVIKMYGMNGFNELRTKKYLMFAEFSEKTEVEKMRNDEAFETAWYSYDELYHN